MAGNSDYDKGIAVKKRAYSENDMDVISFFPSMFAENWQGHIMQELEKNTLRRYRDLMAKPYWSKR